MVAQGLEHLELIADRGDVIQDGSVLIPQGVQGGLQRKRVF